MALPISSCYFFHFLVHIECFIFSFIILQFYTLLYVLCSYWILCIFLLLDIFYRVFLVRWLTSADFIIPRKSNSKKLLINNKIGPIINVLKDYWPNLIKRGKRIIKLVSFLQCRSFEKTFILITLPIYHRTSLFIHNVSHFPNLQLAW